MTVKNTKLDINVLDCSWVEGDRFLKMAIAQKPHMFVAVYTLLSEHTVIITLGVL